ncbi:tRNA-splicing ligase [uncultured archaeon]|nr:tRNA-splicing ligase [uncultured archaeon]
MSVPLNRVDDYTYEIPVTYDNYMNVPGLVYSSPKLLGDVLDDNALQQVVNVATLPGIVKASIAMPDIHWGYGFPIGGVAAFDYDEGLVSPGGVGYDINCGVSLLRTDLKVDDIKGSIKDIVNNIYDLVPAGLGSRKKTRVSEQALEQVLSTGVKWAISEGFGTERDAEYTEADGSLPLANPSKVSDQARRRGLSQLGTLGAGNHFLEIQKVDEIYDREMAGKFGITGKNQITIMIHTGSRGLGHQVATDYLKILGTSPDSVQNVRDRQLMSAHIKTRTGQDYLGAMNAAANFGFVNRQIIVHNVRKAFSKVLGSDFESLGIRLVYSLAHNIAKVEEHQVGGRRMKLVVHRKGATRAFPAGRPELGEVFRETGHPVLIPGDMGSASYVLVGNRENLERSFGSSCHGAGRVLSRKASLRTFTTSDVMSKLEDYGVYVKAASRRVLVEEAPGSYKNIDEVIEAVQGARLADPVARLVPIGVVKG